MAVSTCIEILTRLRCCFFSAAAPAVAAVTAHMQAQCTRPPKQMLHTPPEASTEKDGNRVTNAYSAYLFTSFMHYHFLFAGAFGFPFAGQTLMPDVPLTTTPAAVALSKP
jgi:hypothetical protein